MKSKLNEGGREGGGTNRERVREKKKKKREGSFAN